MNFISLSAVKAFVVHFRVFSSGHFIVGWETSRSTLQTAKCIYGVMTAPKGDPKTFSAKRIRRRGIKHFVDNELFTALGAYIIAFSLLPRVKWSIRQKQLKCQDFLFANSEQ